MMGTSEPLGTTIIDMEQRILNIDDACEVIIIRQRGAVIGKHALSFTYADDVPSNKQALDSLALGGPGYMIVKRYVRGDGSLIWVKNHFTRIKDGVGLPVICSTAQPIGRPFAGGSLMRNYEVVRQLCSVMAIGRRQLSPEVVGAPALEALLWLYRAEMEGASLNADRLAALTSSAPRVMVRWVKVLEERGFVVGEKLGPVDGQTCVRISTHGERKLNGLLAEFCR